MNKKFVIPAKAGIRFWPMRRFRELWVPVFAGFGVKSVERNDRKNLNIECVQNKNFTVFQIIFNTKRSVDFIIK
ncbi:Uncharacterized protein dnm_090370 [Desulfonema magnum]|uniref:Uncharacterized protein n=1 Tax=Desulfonema magnum TaxID=45655 RepID=A0A975BWD1_9BACT|nr:Uncharacterized protein dnm_090370 [Desulfonema magnum]